MSPCRHGFAATRTNRCVECSRGYRAAWKKRHRDHHNAHTQVRRAIRAGRLVRPDRCQLCWESSRRIQGHHQDYARPLEVVWLCEPCHQVIEGRHPEEPQAKEAAYAAKA